MVAVVGTAAVIRTAGAVAMNFATEGAAVLAGAEIGVEGLVPGPGPSPAAQRMPNRHWV